MGKKIIVIGRAILQGSQAATDPVSPNNVRRFFLPFFLVTLIWLAGDTSTSRDRGRD